MLDLDPARDGVTPALAATVVVVRDGPAGVEVFLVERSAQSRFLGGAVVFPGGRVEPADADPAWPVVEGNVQRAVGVAACRELLEEAALLLSDPSLGHEEVLRVREHAELRSELVARGVRLDLRALVPFARWVTPRAERRRFDAWFFVARAPEGQRGAPDARETVSGAWSTPQALLARFDAREVQLAPPTHCTLLLLATLATSTDVLAMARERAPHVEPVCPELVVRGTRMALVLPHHAHGPSRYVLEDERWVPGRPDDPFA